MLRTFFRHQHKYLHPLVSSVWKEQQPITFAKMNDNGQTLILGGDRRADSPGHSAKFGSYTVMDSEQHKVIDIQLVQVC